MGYKLFSFCFDISRRIDILPTDVGSKSGLQSMIVLPAVHLLLLRRRPCPKRDRSQDVLASIAQFKPNLKVNLAVEATSVAVVWKE